jgi:predicted transport protein
MAKSWTCPQCKRRFTRAGQRHACGTGDRASVLRNRPAELVRLYEAFEAFVKKLGPVEFVTRERYVLLRTTRIFADMVFMAQSLRLAIHLAEEAAHPLFFKVVADRRHVTHVAQLREPADLEAMEPFLQRAYGDSLHARGALPLEGKED